MSRDEILRELTERRIRREAEACREYGPVSAGRDRADEAEDALRTEPTRLRQGELSPRGSA